MAKEKKEGEEKRGEEGREERFWKHYCSWWWLRASAIAFKYPEAAAVIFTSSHVVPIPSHRTASHRITPSSSHSSSHHTPPHLVRHRTTERKKIFQSKACLFGPSAQRTWHHFRDLYGTALGGFLVKSERRGCVSAHVRVFTAYGNVIASIFFGRVQKVRWLGRSYIGGLKLTRLRVVYKKIRSRFARKRLVCECSPSTATRDNDCRQQST